MPATEEDLNNVIADLVDAGDTGDQQNDSPFDGIDIDPEEVSGPPVQLTERAGRQVEKIIANHDEDDKNIFLRVAVEGGGCSGLSYKLGLDHKAEEDTVIESHHIEMVVDDKHMIYLRGITIDYPDGLDARGFTFDNPNASETCGCGSSFAT